MRTILGGVVGGLALFLVGFLFWATPLSLLAFKSVDDARNAAVQAALAQNLTETGTGTYVVPWPSTGQGTVMFGQGPVATIHFNTAGFPVMDSAMLVGGLILAIVTGIILAFALRIVGQFVPDFARRAQVALLFALAITLYDHIGQPIFNHYGWGYFVYLFISAFAGFAVAGLVIVRWFLPRPATAATGSAPPP